jgi:hypothetical protein
MADKITSQSLRNFELAASLPKAARENLELAIRDGIYQLRTFLKSKEDATSKKSETVEFAFPASWWQTFKYQYFPTWAKRLLPVRMRIVSRTVEWVETIKICPHLVGEPEAKHLEWLGKGEKEGRKPSG